MTTTTPTPKKAKADPQPGEIWIAERYRISYFIPVDWAPTPECPVQPVNVRVAIISRHEGCGRPYVTFELLDGFTSPRAEPRRVSNGRPVVSELRKAFRKAGFVRALELTDAQLAIVAEVAQLHEFAHQTMVAIQAKIAELHENGAGPMPFADWQINGNDCEMDEYGDPIEPEDMRRYNLSLPESLTSAAATVERYFSED